MEIAPIPDCHPAGLERVTGRPTPFRFSLRTMELAGWLKTVLPGAAAGGNGSE
jgi:hypothetical protein